MNRLKNFFQSFKTNRKKLIITMIIIILVIAAAAGVYLLFFKEEAKTEVTGKTSYGYLNEAVEGSGTTTPADSVSYEINGTVLEWYVTAGQEVKEGDLLYVLDSSDAEDQLIDYETELLELYDDLEEIQENIDNQYVRAEFSGRIENVNVKVGQKVSNGTSFGKLIDDSRMKAVLYFSYIYENDIKTGMDVTASLPDQMLTLSGTVTDIKYVDYITAEGMKCFAVYIEIDNPGSLAEGTTVTAWITDENGNNMYSVTDAKLEYVQSENITAGASGELAAVNVTSYQRVNEGDILYIIDASSYDSQLTNVKKQIESLKEKIDDLQTSIDTEYTRYADISGQVVTASYSSNRMTGRDSGSVIIYNQDTMEISVNIDELDADYLTQGMDVTVYRTTSSRTVYYPATLSYLSLTASSGSSGVSTFKATITIESEGELSSGVTVYYSIDTSGSSAAGEAAQETVLAPVAGLCTYDDGYYFIIKADSRPSNAIDPSKTGGTVTEYPSGYYAVPVNVGDYNGNYIQILSGLEKDTTVFLRYMNAKPSGGDSTSLVTNDDESGFSFGDMEMPDMSNFGGGGGSMSGGGGSMPSGGGSMPSGGGSMPGGRN